MAKYDVHHGLIRKGLVDILLALIELFSLAVTAQTLRAKCNVNVNEHV